MPRQKPKNPDLVKKPSAGNTGCIDMQCRLA